MLGEQLDSDWVSPPSRCSAWDLPAPLNSHCGAEFEDVWKTAVDDEVDQLYASFWESTAPGVSIGRRLWRQFYADLRNGALLYLVFVLCGLGSPVLLWALVDHLQHNDWGRQDLWSTDPNPTTQEDSCMV